jgi:hypothetical protein
MMSILCCTQMYLFCATTLPFHNTLVQQGKLKYGMEETFKI